MVIDILAAEPRGSSSGCAWRGRATAGGDVRRALYTLKCLAVRRAPFRKFGTAILRGALCAAPFLGYTGTAHAQVEATTLVEPAIQADYSRDRNVSVTQQSSPDFNPVGVSIGTFNAFPSVSLSTGATTNVYLNDANKRGDVFAALQPSLIVFSNWSNHQLYLDAQGEMERFAKETLRDRDSYHINARGRLDITREWKAEASLMASRAAESPYSANQLTDAVVLSQYDRVAPSLRVERQVGRSRLVATVEQISFRFNDLLLGNGTIRSQRERDRTVRRVAGQFEYALSPSISVYSQVNYDKTSYEALRLNGSANRDSKAWSIIGGTNFDLAGLMRGTVGIGYTNRNYRAAIYDDARGLSLQARLELFLSPLTTATVSAQQLLQDSNLGNGSAYRDSRVSIKVDHALLRNLLLSGGVTLAKQTLLETDADTNLAFASFTATYQSSRELGISANVRYGDASSKDSAITVPFQELRGQLSVRIRR